MPWHKWHDRLYTNHGLRWMFFFRVCPHAFQTTTYIHAYITYMMRARKYHRHVGRADLPANGACQLGQAEDRKDLISFHPLKHLLSLSNKKKRKTSSLNTFICSLRNRSKSSFAHTKKKNTTPHHKLLPFYFITRTAIQNPSCHKSGTFC